MHQTPTPSVKEKSIPRTIVPWQRALFLVVVLILISGWYLPIVGSVEHARAADLKTEDALFTREANIAPATELPTLTTFIRSVQNGNHKSLVGVYVPGQWAFPVSQQPASNPGFVSSNSEVVTQFSLAAQYDTVGLLAHNYLAGSSFFELNRFNKVALIFGDGNVKFYRIKEIERYRAISPNSPYSSFENLQDPGVIISVTELFNRIYAPGNRLVLQTCIEENGILSWGRLFVSAKPMDHPVKISYNYRPEKFRLD